jgi:photosystem II stability/assembly factor-like uncharacterized protein
MHVGVLASARVGTVPDITDSFNRSNGSLGTTDTGQTWSTTGTTAISSNTALLSGTATATLSTSSPDMKISAKYVSISSGYDALKLRGAVYQVWSVGGYWWVRRSGDVDTRIDAAGTPAANDVVALKVAESGGSTAMELWVNGASKWTYTDTNASRDKTTQSAGLSSYLYGGNFDDLRVEHLS